MTQEFDTATLKGATLTPLQRRLCAENIARLQQQKRARLQSLLDFAGNVPAKAPEHPAPVSIT